MSNDNWRTPDWLYNYCEQMFGPFDVDLAASEANTKCKRYIDIATNALVTDWQAYGNYGFCNPPYSNLPPWLRRAKAYSQNKGFTSTWILPTFNGEKHWLTNVYQRGASYVINICGRIGFLDYFGKPIAGNRQGTQIVHYGLPSRQKPPDQPRILYVDRDELIKRYNAK